MDTYTDTRGPLAESTPDQDRANLVAWLAAQDIPQWPGCAPYVPSVQA